MLTLETDNMTSEKPKSQPKERKSEADATLGRIIDIIVNEFSGDTAAFYESIRQDAPNKDQQADDKEAACIAQRFAKSV
jgi:hypothetical protein